MSNPDDRDKVPLILGDIVGAISGFVLGAILILGAIGGVFPGLILGDIINNGFRYE